MAAVLPPSRTQYITMADRERGHGNLSLADKYSRLVQMTRANFIHDIYHLNRTCISDMLL